MPWEPFTFTGGTAFVFPDFDRVLMMRVIITIIAIVAASGGTYILIMAMVRSGISKSLSTLKLTRGAGYDSEADSDVDPHDPDGEYVLERQEFKDAMRYRG